MILVLRVPPLLTTVDKAATGPQWLGYCGVVVTPLLLCVGGAAAVMGERRGRLGGRVYLPQILHHSPTRTLNRERKEREDVTRTLKLYIYIYSIEQIAPKK